MILATLIVLPALILGDANQVMGVVYRSDGGPFTGSAATVSVNGRDDISDNSLGSDGSYSLQVPTAIDQFELTFTASGYWTGLSAVIANNQPVLKQGQTTLQKISVSGARNREALQKRVEAEVTLYGKKATPRMRETMKRNLETLAATLEKSDVKQKEVAIAIVREGLDRMK